VELGSAEQMPGSNHVDLLELTRDWIDDTWIGATL